MNPKDMTHVELLSEAMASMLDIGACYEGLEQERADSDVIRVEFLRRLDEADALRKENEELHHDKERLDKLEEFFNNPDWSLDRELNGPFNYGPNGRVRWSITEACEVLGDGKTLREAIDGMTESEASHE